VDADVGDITQLRRQRRLEVRGELLAVRGRLGLLDDRDHRVGEAEDLRERIAIDDAERLAHLAALELLERGDDRLRVAGDQRLPRLTAVVQQAFERAAEAIGGRLRGGGTGGRRRLAFEQDARPLADVGRRRRLGVLELEGKHVDASGLGEQLLEASFELAGIAGCIGLGTRIQHACDVLRNAEPPRELAPGNVLIESIKSHSPIREYAESAALLPQNPLAQRGRNSARRP
jgi:hypothetical protein